MNPGDLRESITFQLLDENVYEDIETVRAAVEAQGNELYRIRIRWFDDIRGFQDARPAMRILWRDRVLDITDVIEVVPRREVNILAQVRLTESRDLASGAHQIEVWPQPA
jgi:head-tail adaptor